MDDSVITCDEIIDAEGKETFPTNFNEKKVACKGQNLSILLAFFINYYGIIDSC